jgi:hypothetical protein
VSICRKELLMNEYVTKKTRYLFWALRWVYELSEREMLEEPLAFLPGMRAILTFIIIGI